MTARGFAWLMRRAGLKARALPGGPVGEALDALAARYGGGRHLPAVVFESAALEGFMWQMCGLRVIGLSSGLVRRFMLRRGDCPEFAHIVRHELEHSRRGHWLAGAWGNALSLFGARLRRAGERIIAALEEEADAYDGK